MGRAVLQPVARGRKIITGAGSAGTSKMTGNTAHQKARPDMGLPAWESAQKMEQATGGVSPMKHPRSGNTVLPLERFWTLLIR